MGICQNSYSSCLDVLLFVSGPHEAGDLKERLPVCLPPPHSEPGCSLPQSPKQCIWLQTRASRSACFLSVPQEAGVLALSLCIPPAALDLVGALPAAFLTFPHWAHTLSSMDRAVVSQQWGRLGSSPQPRQPLLLQCSFALLKSSLELLKPR